MTYNITEKYLPSAVKNMTKIKTYNPINHTNITTITYLLLGLNETAEIIDLTSFKLWQHYKNSLYSYITSIVNYHNKNNNVLDGYNE